LSYEGLGSNM